MTHSSKNIWVITHDNHIDHRILFVSKSLLQQGNKVKLFAGQCFSIFDEDQDFIVRPYINQSGNIDSIFKCQNINTDDCKELGVVKSIISTFDLGKINASEVIKKRTGIYQCVCVKDKEGIIYIDILNDQTKTHFYWNSYDEEIKEVLVSDFGANSLAFCYYYDKLIQSKFHKPSFLSNFYKSGLIKKKEEQNISFYKNKIYSGNVNDYLVIDLDHNTFVSCSKLLGLSRGTIEFQGQKFYFNEFCENIYNFTPIFQSLLRFIDEKPDYVYVADLPTLPIGYILKKVLGVKLIVDCHEWWMGQSLLWEPDATKKIQLINKYEKYLYSACDKRITIGQQLGHFLEHYFSLPFEYFYTVSNHIINYNEVSALESSELRKEEFWHSKFSIPKNAKVCIFQGSLTSNRNIENLVKSVDYLNNNHYMVIIGNGPIFSSLQSLSKKLNKKKQIIFVGWVSQEELLAFAINADVGVIPYVAINEYYATSAPNKLSEYYAAHLPIVADSSMKEICSNITKDRVGLMVNCKKPSVLGESISKLLNDNDLLISMKKAYEQKLETFDEKTQQQKVLDILLNH